MAQNRAAWIQSEKANPLQIDDAPMPKSGPGDVVFKNHAVAVVCISIPSFDIKKKNYIKNYAVDANNCVQNPIDWKIQYVFNYTIYISKNLTRYTSVLEPLNSALMSKPTPSSSASTQQVSSKK